jgi:hypothetical protein
MKINLRDYRNSQAFFEYDLITGVVAQLKIRPNSTSGYCSLRKKRFFSRGMIFAAIFIKDQSVCVVLNSKQYEANQINNVRCEVEKCLGFSVFRKFFIVENGIHIDEVNYSSFSSSEEEWPDDYSDIFRFIANTLSKKFDLVSLRNELIESDLGD